MNNKIRQIISVLLVIGFSIVLIACGKTIGSKQEVQVLSGSTEASSEIASEEKTQEQTTKDASAGKETETTTAAQTAGGNSTAGQQSVTNTPVSGGSGNGYSGGQQVQPQTEAPTQPPTEAPTQAPTQPPTEAPTQPPAPQYVITITVDGCGYGGYGVMSSCTLSFPYQPSVYDSLCNSGVGIEGSGYYVSAINGLREKAYGTYSGWMYSVNGTTPMISCGSYYLSSGDNVYWYYVGD